MKLAYQRHPYKNYDLYYKLGVIVCVCKPIALLLRLETALSSSRVFVYTIY